MKDFIATIFVVIGIYAFVALYFLFGEIEQNLVSFTDGIKKSVLYCVLLIISVVIELLLTKDDRRSQNV